MKLLLDEYHQVKVKRLEYLIDFYVQFEHIRPFQDGNGRVGRLLFFKECLNHYFAISSVFECSFVK